MHIFRHYFTILPPSYVDITIFVPFRYDFPDPGSEIDYIVDNRVDYIKYYDGVAVIKFKKKTTNTKPFVR